MRGLHIDNNRWINLEVEYMELIKLDDKFKYKLTLDTFSGKLYTIFFQANHELLNIDNAIKLIEDKECIGDIITEIYKRKELGLIEAKEDKDE